MKKTIMVWMGALAVTALLTGMAPMGALGAEQSVVTEAPVTPDAAEPAPQTDTKAVPATADNEQQDEYTAPADAPEDGRPWLIRVNLTDMVVSIYARDDQGEYTRLIKQFVGTAGAWDKKTPENVYTLQAYRDKDHYFVKFDCYAAYATQIQGPFMFHSVIFNEPGMKSMNNSYNQLGRAASHGCVRLMPDEAQWIYEHCKAGTVVDIYEGDANPDLTESLLPPPSIDGKYPADMPPKVGETDVPAVKAGER